MKKQLIFKIILSVWIVLWIFFLAREDKDGQYRMLKYFYTHDPQERIQYLLGDDLHDFLVFCKANISHGDEYELIDFENSSITHVRARYFLWPLKNLKGNSDYKIVLDKKNVDIPGYRVVKPKSALPGLLLIKEETGR